MNGFIRRHWTAVAIGGAVALWAIFYLPATPSYAVYQLKRAIDAHDGARASEYVDFESVVKHAGDEMAKQEAGAGNDFNAMIARGALAMFSKQLAEIAKSWAVRQVDEGAKEVQVPAGAVLGAIVLLSRDGDNASTRFEDPQGRQWEIHFARNRDGVWQVSEVSNIQQLLAQLQAREASPTEER